MQPPWGVATLPVNQGFTAQESAMTPRGSTDVRGNARVYAASYDVTMDGTSRALVPYDSDRYYLMIQNNTDADITLGFGVDAAAGAGLKVPAGEAYEPKAAICSPIYALGLGSGYVTVVEGT